MYARAPRNPARLSNEHVRTDCILRSRHSQYTAGKYLKDARPPFDCGFECVGTVVAVGPACTRLKVGQHVAASAYGMFAEYVTLPENSVMVR
jgi:NADPH:quinone reductase-like Zn-dependent oxidoreductase